jgi:hypothetical protein
LTPGLARICKVILKCRPRAVEAVALGNLMSGRGGFMGTVGKWLGGVAAAVLAAIVVWLITSPDSCVRKGNSPEARQWEQDWVQINQPVPFLGESSGVRATNRAKYRARLEGLSLSGDTHLQRLRNDLVSRTREAPAHGDGSYDMLLTGAIESSFEDLKQRVRNRAQEYDVDVAPR